MARKPRNKGKGPETPESPGGTTGHGLERQGEEGRLRGLVRYPPGTNGGVHRGPDRYPRITQGMFMKALVADQVRFVVVAGKKRKQRVVVPRAMVEDMVKGIQLIARRGAQGRNFKEFMRLWELAGKVFPLGPPDKNGASQPPRPPTFVRPTETASGTEELKASISPPTTPGTLIGPDGQEYVVARHHHAGQEDGLSE